MQSDEIDLWRQRREDIAREAAMERLARKGSGGRGGGLGRVRALLPPALRANRPENECA